MIVVIMIMIMIIMANDHNDGTRHIALNLFSGPSLDAEVLSGKHERCFLSRRGLCAIVYRLSSVALIFVHFLGP